MKIVFVSLTIIFLILTILLGTNTIKVKGEWSSVLYTYISLLCGITSFAILLTLSQQLNPL